MPIRPEGAPPPNDQTRFQRQMKAAAEVAKSSSTAPPLSAINPMAPPINRDVAPTTTILYVSGMDRDYHAAGLHSTVARR